MAAKPFVRPSFDAKVDEAAKVAMDRMNLAIDTVLAK